MNVSDLSDEELYALYCKALAGRYRSGADASTSFSPNRLLTALDAILYFLIARAAGGIAWLLGFPCLLSVVGIPSGPFALVGAMYSDERFVPPMPGLGTIDLRSAEVLGKVAQFLSDPILNGARTLQLRLRQERALSEKLLERTMGVYDDLDIRLRSLSDPALRDSYESRIEEARGTAHKLRERIAELSEHESRVRSATASLDLQVSQLMALATAESELAAVNRAMPDAAPMRQDSALQYFSAIRANMELAQENLSEISKHLSASDHAKDEVKSLSLNDF